MRATDGASSDWQQDTPGSRSEGHYFFRVEASVTQAFPDQNVQALGYRQSGTGSWSQRLHCMCITHACIYMHTIPNLDLRYPSSLAGLDAKRGNESYRVSPCGSRRLNVANLGKKCLRQRQTKFDKETIYAI